MSELQTRFIDDTYCEYYKTGKHDLAQVYLKSEADAFIAELEESHKKEVGQLLIEELRHQKYKRCLAMAVWCDETMMSCELRVYNIHRIWARKHEWAMRWKYKWLELAENFKRAK